MRLIDADSIKFTTYINGDITVSKEAIKKIPTAYDVDKVVEGLEQQKSQYFIRAEEIKNKFGENSETNRLISKACSYNNAIKIVKSGGILKE